MREGHHPLVPVRSHRRSCLRPPTERHGGVHGRQSSAEETEDQEEGHPAVGVTQCLAQAVGGQVVQGEELVRLQVGGAAGQHVAHRVESLPTPPMEGELTSGELMQHELFDFTDGAVDGGSAPRAGEVDVVRTIRHQPRALRQCTSAILRNFLHLHSRCHTRWIKRREIESLQAEFAAARAYGGREQGDVECLSPGTRRKLCLELAGKRAVLAE